jgi:uncharacterized membrane protein YdjX (TVP38/TMEM64 family)
MILNKKTETNKTKILFIAILLIVVSSILYFDLHKYLSFETLKSSQEIFQTYYDQNPYLTIGIYLAVYILATALSLPGATVLTLAGGALFGLGTGLLAVSFASTIGATLAFIGCRYLLRDWVIEKFGNKLKKLNEGIEKEGSFYLFTLRLVPVFPFFVINLAMGLTPISTAKFFFVSQLGMLPGTAVYVNAGTQLAKLDSLEGILSPGLLGSFALLGVFPFIAKRVIEYFQKKRATEG